MLTCSGKEIGIHRVFDVGMATVGVYVFNEELKHGSILCHGPDYCHSLTDYLDSEDTC